MHISKSFIPILKNNPSEAKIKSHQLMLRVGMIKQSSAGIYSWLPLGFKVMKKIEQIVREEQDGIGVQEILRFLKKCPGPIFQKPATQLCLKKSRSGSNS